MSEPLSIRTAIDSPYTDRPVDGSRVLYNFAPLSREHENDGLKRCAELELPLIYLLQTKRKPNPEYFIFAPVFVVGWDDAARTFLVDLSEIRPGEVVSPSPTSLQIDLSGGGLASAIHDIAKSYTVTAVARRLHQARFRNRVLEAYRERCAVCVLRVRPLLDAAHVVPDIDPKPVIEISEGLALCAIHHRAFDSNIIRYDSAYRIEIELPTRSAAGEPEERMLLDFAGKRLTLPSDSRFWPVTRT
jgi:putative restriction endonuclease